MSFGINKSNAPRSTSLASALAQQSEQPAAAAPGEVEERPKTKLWLNVGITVPFINEEGEQDEEFISLPFGLALDQMKPARVTNSDSLTSKRNAAKNRLLEQLVKFGLEGVQPGSDAQLTDLEVRLRHASEDISSLGVQNEFTDAVDKLFTVG